MKRIALVICVVLVALLASVWFWRQLQPDTRLSETNATTSHITLATPKTKTFTRPTFTIALPDDWTEQPSTLPDTPFHVQGTTKTDNARSLDIYVDTIPDSLALNRLLPVHADGNKLQTSGDVSDNCTEFTDKATTNPQTAAAPAKWAGVSFLCDEGNYLRDVIGTGSADGANTVRVNGPKSGSHSYFFVYTDHAGQPDYDTFTRAVASLRAL